MLFPRSGQNHARRPSGATAMERDSSQRRDLALISSPSRASDIRLDSSGPFRCDDVPGRLRFPRGVGHTSREGLANMAPASRPSLSSSRRASPGREVRGRAPSGSDRGSRQDRVDAGDPVVAARIPSRWMELAHVRCGTPGDVHQRGDLSLAPASVITVPPTSGHEDDGPFLGRRCALCCRHIIRERGERVLHGDDVADLWPRATESLCPARSIGECAVDENHRLLPFLLS